MDDEFITIGEAARFLRQADSAVMRLIKEALQAGVEKENIMKAEMHEGRMMYLVSKTFLIDESVREKARAVPKEDPLRQDKDEASEARPEDSGRDERFKKQTESLFGDVLSVKDDMIAILQKVMDTKDQQIGDLSGKIDQLIERDHETNILMKGLQDRLFLLEQGHSQNSTEPAKEKKK